jgi:hypothetical protein
MNAQELLKKYGIWIAGFAIVGYLAYRNLRGGSTRSLIAPPPPGAAGFSADQYRLESERLRQSGTLDLERLRLDAALEAARRRAEIDRFNIESQDAARRRAQDAQERGQTLGLIGQAINAVAALLRGQQSQNRSGSSGGVGTPPTFPSGGGRTQPQSAPFYMVPEPKINVLYDPSYQPSFPSAPEYIPLRIDDWGEPPAFQSSGLDFDGGATFYNQSVFGADGGDFYYGYGYDEQYSELPTLGAYSSGFYYPEAGEDFYYGFGEGGSDPARQFSSYPEAGEDFVYGYGEGYYEEGA